MKSVSSFSSTCIDMFINTIAFHVHYVYRFHQYFAGDIAFRFLQYIQSQTDDSIMSEENFSIPSGIGAGAYSIPSEYAEEEKIDLSDYKEDTSHVTVCDINQEMLNVGKSRAEDAGIVTGQS